MGYYLVKDYGVKLKMMWVRLGQCEKKQNHATMLFQPFNYDEQVTRVKFKACKFSSFWKCKK